MDVLLDQDRGAEHHALGGNEPMKGKGACRFEQDVFPREVQRIDARRRAASLKELGPPPDKPTTKLGLIGLALSGGGIRSATFSLGVIQALSDHGLFHKVDYLSTVSGGGYIGACLTTLLGDKQRPADAPFPLAEHQGEKPEPTVSYLRTNADYLSPGGASGRLRLVAMVLRGMVLNLLLVLQAVLFATSITACIYWSAKYLTGRLALARCDADILYRSAAIEVGRWAHARGLVAASSVIAVASGAVVAVAARRWRAARIAAKAPSETRSWESRERRELRATGYLAAVLALAVCVPFYRMVSWAIDTPWGTRHGLTALWWSAAFGRLHAAFWAAGLLAIVGILSAVRGPVGKWTRTLALYGVGVLGPGVPVLLYLLLCMQLIQSPYIDPDLMEALRQCASDNVLGCGERMPNLREWANVLKTNGFEVEGREWTVRTRGADGAWTATLDGTDTPLMILEPLAVMDLRAALKARGIEVEGESFKVRRSELGWTLDVNGKESPPFESIDLTAQLRKVMLMQELEEALNDKGLSLREGHWTVSESSGFSFRGENWRGWAPRDSDCLLGDGSNAPVWIVSAEEAGGVRDYPLLFDQPARVTAALGAILDDCRGAAPSGDRKSTGAQAAGGEGADAACTDDAGTHRVAAEQAAALKAALEEEGLNVKGRVVGLRLVSGLSWVVKTDDGKLFPIIPERGRLHVRNLGVTVGLDRGRNGIALSIALWLASVVLFRLVDVNKASLCGFYRDRLSRLFLIRVDPMNDEIIHCDDLKMSSLADDTAAPYHLINATLNVRVDKGHRLHSRQADFFMFSQHFVGSEHTGYCATKDLEKEDDKVDLGTAMAISAAAAAPNMGTLTIKPLVFIMTLLNLRLAYWVPNPREVCARLAEDDASLTVASARRWLRELMSALHVRRPGLRYFIREALGRLSTDGPYVNVSDGGHLENTGIYQLLRRRCRLIIAVDGEADPKMEFTSLMSMMRYARIDLGVQFEDVQLDPIRRKDGFSKEHWMLARIRYSSVAGEPPELGTLLYIKSSMTGDEPEYLRAYKKAAPAFPHHSTADQFFNETQFEAYRALGEHVGHTAIRDAKLAALLEHASALAAEGSALAAEGSALAPLSAGG